MFPSYVPKLCFQVNYYHQLGPIVGPNRFGPNCSKGEIRQQSKKRILNFKWINANDSDGLNEPSWISLNDNRPGLVLNIPFVPLLCVRSLVYSFQFRIFKSPIRFYFFIRRNFFYSGHVKKHVFNPFRPKAQFAIFWEGVILDYFHFRW